ncbi:hypothetical protein A8C32_07045 [Flavivirga aquatica]|uniref:Lipoprotein n=1 Tax=Flavivirga aquatica TaxID=1849968 RepID=A0A1E5SIJ3_9FLAO|nr:hypothetical protein [Flavivirga aquatica]OEJ98938.1 hypothetical protein A8C32_07045 [Flavivirga aquatica]
MKNLLIVPLLFSVFTIGCNSKSKKNEEKELKKEKEVSNQVEAEKNSQNYLLLNNAAGKFKIGSPIPFPKTSNHYKVRKETQTIIEEGVSVEETVYIVSKGEKNILHLKQGYNSQNINEITVLSSLFATSKGIGINSTIEDFITQYPNYKIWYTYVSGVYVIETKEINAQFLLNAKNFIGNPKITSDITVLKKEDFKPGTKIIKIRMI